MQRPESRDTPTAAQTREERLADALDRIIQMFRWREAEDLPLLAFNMSEVAREALYDAE